MQQIIAPMHLYSVCKYLLYMRNHFAISLVFLLCISMLFFGCIRLTPPEYHFNYYGIAGEEILVPQGETDMIPQEGTILTLNLSYEIDSVVTRFTFDPDYVDYYQYYRYRVFIDDWYYCGRTIKRDTKVSIPIMANDSYSPVTVRVEGSRSTNYEGTEWADWHEIYRGIQNPLAETEELEYSCLEDLHLTIKMIDTEFTFNLIDSGAAQVFKRLLKDRKYQILASVPSSRNEIKGHSTSTGSSFDYFISRVKSLVPVDDSNYEGKDKAGALFVNGSTIRIALTDGHTGTYIGSVVETQLEDLLSFLQTHTNPATMTLYLK